MLRAIKTFRNDEAGAVTVDWVVLTAALVGLGLAVLSVMSGGVETLSGEMSTSLTEIDPHEAPFNADGITATAPVTVTDPT
ncbi:hypothetical protein JSE7799_00062 [Jannaschia seosinensis]|uniref:Flp pilus assembly protein, pilin Flp n=1 Tax=Jannaschia seosinensis TaxID=313367 RepID=A0A0M7B6D2_9RHOB|nr:hypothetical protein [Jannaschia seosinensis]CUH08469.1 hypothetical protein JSE7799_00062 [Jannaschia seosinensis]